LKKEKPRRLFIVSNVTVVILAWVLAWPLILAVSVGEVVRERSERHGRLKREFDEQKARVEKALEKKP
jgi:hypothetical protein